jgi:molybdenum cofactor cytidylyltransferase
MTSRCRVGLVMLAGGAATRFGAPKQLTRLAGQPMLQRVLGAAQASPCDPIVLVLGAHAAQIAAEVDLSGVRVVHNREWREGIASSIRCGLHAVMSDSTLSALVVTLADLPCVTADDYARLIDVHARQPTVLVAARTHGGLGVPALFPRDSWSELQRLRGDTGARRLLANHRARTVAISVPGAGDDVDTPNDLLRLSAIQQGIQAS